MSPFPYAGETFALAAALVWSFAVILFRRAGETIPPIALNLSKNTLSILLFTVTLVVLQQPLLKDVPSSHYVLLIASGAIGIGLSDTLFLMTLNRMGAGLTAIIDTSYSPWIIVLSLLFLGESLSVRQWIGVALILSAVLGVVWMRGPAGERSARDLVVGIALGNAAMLSQAISIVMIKRVLEVSPLIWANWWRMVGGVGIALILLPLWPARHRHLDSLRRREAWPTLVGATVLGTFVALLFWLGGMKYAQASTASVLNQTSTLWTFVLAALLLGEPVTWRRVIGLLLGVLGVLLVTIG